MTEPRLPSAERLLELVEAMRSQPVLMLADLVADRFVTGTPKRISREAPVLILRHEEEVLVPGGGANAVANVAALAGEPLVIGLVGGDSSGDELLAELQARGISTEGVRRRQGYRTPTKVRILGGARHSLKQQIVRYDIEDELLLDDADRTFFAGRLESWQNRCRVAVLSDYGYGTVDPSLTAGLRRALRSGGHLLCDSRHRLSQFANLDGATPNEEETEAELGEGLGESLEVAAARGQRLRRRLGLAFLLITRGSAGMLLILEHGVVQIPVHGTDQVADVTGAGDTVIGTFALSLSAGASPLEASLMANYAGGVVVMKRGTATLEPGELRAAIASDSRPIEELRWAA